MTAYAIGFSRRKRDYLQSFLGRQVSPAPSCDSPDVAGLYYVWGDTPLPKWLPHERVIYVEDGFIRSVGLGAAFSEPLSWVLDRKGLHHWTTPTELEVLLQHARLGFQDIQRARALRERIVRAGLTKYNVGTASWAGLPTEAAGQKRVLVVGQVPGDAALRGICTPARTNQDLIKAAREANPDAFLIYKPHPDVVAGLRDADDRSAEQLADLVVGHVSVDRMLSEVDEVHVLNSLAGFEALLREVPVVCHATPFYAGWGLTADIHQPPRRNRTLSLDELVYVALIAYPSYRSPVTGQRCSPEEVVEVLEARLASQPHKRAAGSVAGQVLGRVVKALGRAERRQPRGGAEA